MKNIYKRLLSFVFAWILQLTKRFPAFKSALLYVVQKQPFLSQKLRILLFRHNRHKASSAQSKRIPLAQKPPTHVTHPEYFTDDLNSKLCHEYNLGFSPLFVEEIRTKKENYQPNLDNLDDIEHYITHTFLALLFRFPSESCLRNFSQRIIIENTADTFIKDLLNSKEFKARGYKKAIQ